MSEMPVVIYGLGPHVMDCPGCKDEDDDDDDIGVNKHRAHSADCFRHRPTQVTTLAWLHVDKCLLCRADIRQETALQLTHLQLTAQLGDDSCRLICSEFLGHPQPNQRFRGPPPLFPGSARLPPDSARLPAKNWQKFHCPHKGKDWWWHGCTGVWFFVDDTDWQSYTNPSDGNIWWWNRCSQWWFWERGGTPGHPLL